MRNSAQLHIACLHIRIIIAAKVGIENRRKQAFESTYTSEHGNLFSTAIGVRHHVGRYTPSSLDFLIQFFMFTVHNNAFAHTDREEL